MLSPAHGGKNLGEAAVNPNGAPARKLSKKDVNATGASRSVFRRTRERTIMPDPQPSRFSLSKELSKNRVCGSCMGSGLTYRDPTASWQDVSVWVSLLILLILLATWLYVGSYRSEYGAQESRLVSGTRDHPVAVLHTPDAIYVLGGGTLADTKRGFVVQARPWGGTVSPLGGEGSVDVIRVLPPWSQD